MEIIEQYAQVVMEKHTYYRYYRVMRHDTTIATISANDFKPVRIRAKTSSSYYILNPEYELYYQSANLVNAMKKAKAGALAYIDKLIGLGEQGLPELLKYRIEHYEDLHINLVDANIQQVEQQLSANNDYKWQPYKIQI